MKDLNMQLHERLEAVSTSRVDGPSKLVLIMLAKRLDREDPDGVVWCSSETLADECGVSTKSITRTMDRLTEAGIIRIVSKAAQGRSARKAIDWGALAGADRGAGTIDNIPNEKRRSVGSRSDESSDLEATNRRTLGRRIVGCRSDGASEDPISDPISDPIKESDHGSDQALREPAPLDRHAARSLLAEIETHPGGPERRGCPSIDVLDEDPGDACSWPACLGHGCSVMPTSSADKRTDLAARLRQLPVAADSNLAAGGIAAAAVIRDALGIAAQSTAPPAPATPQAAAPPPKTSSVMAPQVDPGAADGLFGAVPEPKKPKKKKAKKTAAPDPAAWQICADHWSTVIGRPHGLSMERGSGQSLMEAIQAHGAALIVRRFAYLAADGNGNGRWMRDNKVPITAAVPEGSSRFTTKIDRAAVDWEDAKIAGAGAHDASGGAGRVDSWSGWDGASGRQSGARGGWDAWGDGLAEIARGKPVDFIDVELVENKRLEVSYE